MNLTALRASALRKVSMQLTSSDYPNTDVDANLNEWYRQCVGWVIGASGIWEYQGEKSTTDLVQDQIEYLLPTAMIYLNRVSIKYPNSSSYVLARRIDDKSTDSAFENNAIAQGTEAGPVYRVFDNSIFIYPKPSAAVVGGLAIETVEDITDLASGGDIPNLPLSAQKILACGAARDYAESEEMWNKVSSLERQIFGRPGGDGKDGLKYLLEELSANHDRSVRPQVIPRRMSFK